MTWTEFVYALGEFFQWTFTLLQAGENKVNWLFIVIGSAMLLGWIVLQLRYNKEAALNGTME